jgi:hypothetical protein
MTTILSPKDPSEVVSVTFDFSSVITDITEVITSSTWTITPIIGIDANSSVMLATPTNVKSSTSNNLSAGLNGNTYKILVSVTTNKSQTFKLAANIKVISL